MEKAINARNGETIKIPKDMKKLRIKVMRNGNVSVIFKDV